MRYSRIPPDDDVVVGTGPRGYTARDAAEAAAAAAYHEGGHLSVGRFFYPDLAADAHIWPDMGAAQFLGRCRINCPPRHRDPLLSRLIGLSGAYGYSLAAGITNPDDIVMRMSRSDIEMMGIPGVTNPHQVRNSEWLAGDLRYLKHTLGGRLRDDFRWASKALNKRWRAGDWNRFPTPPSGWHAPS
jgi:hypothetical protein